MRDWVFATYCPGWHDTSCSRFGCPSWRCCKGCPSYVCISFLTLCNLYFCAKSVAMHIAFSRLHRTDNNRGGVCTFVVPPSAGTIPFLLPPGPILPSMPQSQGVLPQWLFFHWLHTGLRKGSPGAAPHRERAHPEVAAAACVDPGGVYGVPQL